MQRPSPLLYLPSYFTFPQFLFPECIIKIVKIRIKMKIQRNKEMSRISIIKDSLTVLWSLSAYRRDTFKI